MKNLSLLLLLSICFMGNLALAQDITGAEDDGLSKNLEVFQIGEKFYVKDASKYLSWNDLKPFQHVENKDVKEIVKVFVIMDDYGYELDGIIYKNLGKATFKNKVYKFKRKS